MKYIKYIIKKIWQIFKYSLFIMWPVIVIIALTIISADEEELNLNIFDYCNLTDVDYTAVLQNDSTVKITEYLTFDVHAGSKSNLYKELWRELPEDTVDGLKVTYNVESVTQILEDGGEIPYTETNKMYWEDYDYTQDSTYYWHHSDGSGYYPDNDESVLIYIPWTYREKMTFRIEYTMNNAALKYNDCSELYLSMYSGTSIRKLKSYKAQILVPNELMPSDYYSYTFGTSKSRIPYEESDALNPGYHTFYMDLGKKDLKFNFTNRYIEFCLLAYGEDRHIFTEYAPDNLYTSDNVLDECIEENEYYQNMSDQTNKTKRIIFGASLVIVVIIVISTRKKYNKAKNKNTLFYPEMEYDYYREIPSDLDPIFASDLVFMKDPLNSNADKKEEYAAVLLSLARKGYVKIEKQNPALDWSNSNTVIHLTQLDTVTNVPDFTDSPDYSPEPIYKTINSITGETLEPLSTSERLYFELLERYSRVYGNIIAIKDFQYAINNDYNYRDAFVKDIEKKPILENGVMNGYFQNAQYDTIKKDFEKSSNTSFNLSFIFIVIINLIAYFIPITLCYGAFTIIGLAFLWRAIYLIEKSSKLILFTQEGVNEQAKWYGFYNFLNSDTLLNEKEVHELPLWEKYLIYATAFGVSEKVIKAIKIHAVNIDTTSSTILHSHSYVHSSRFHSTSRSFGRSLHTSSRGGFSGHGYGGGGRGGRWWWRWSLKTKKL